jgi:hypothetical protein
MKSISECLAMLVAAPRQNRRDGGHDGTGESSTDAPPEFPTSLKLPVRYWMGLIGTGRVL